MRGLVVVLTVVLLSLILLPVVTQAPAPVWSMTNTWDECSELMARLESDKHSWLTEQATAMEHRGQAEALRSYMIQAHCSPTLIDLAPLMVTSSLNTGMDCRMAAVTAVAESSGGLGSADLFGTSCHYESFDEQVRWYYGRIKEISDEQGYGGDCWHLAYYWYGGGSPEGKNGGSSAAYADTIVQSIQTIGW
jgi:hypothetical protein